jgi:hypothetical protein
MANKKSKKIQHQDNLGHLTNILIQKLEGRLKQVFMILEVEDQKENFHILMICFF